MALSALELEMSMNLARLQTDAGKAVKIVEGFGRNVIGTALAGLSVNALKDYATGVVGALAALDDMAERTGAAVEGLSKLSAVAGIGGHSMETVEMGLIRLAKALGSVDEKAAPAKEALKSIGIDPAKLKTTDTAEAFQLVAEKLNAYKDGLNKTALLVEIFGKSGAQLAPIIKDMADQHEKLRIVTAEEAAQAEVLEKQWKSLNLVMAEAKKAMVMDMIPALNEIVGAMKEAYKESGLLMALWVGLGGVAANLFKRSDADTIDLLNRKIDGTRASLERLNDVPGPYSNRNAARKSALADELLRDINARDAILARQNPIVMPKIELPDAPKIQDPKTAKAAEAAAKQAADAYQKMLESFSKMSMDAVKDTSEREKKVIEDAYADKLMSAKEYFDSIAALQTQQYEAMRAALQQRKAQEEAFAKGKTGKDQIDALGKVQQTTFDLLALERARNAEVTAGWRAQTAAAFAYFETIDEIRAQAIAAGGDEATAAKMRIDAQQAAWRRNPDIANNEEALKDLDLIRAQGFLQIDLNKYKNEYAMILDRVKLQEEGVARMMANGSISQIEGMRQQGSIRQNVIKQLEEVAEKQREAIANTGVATEAQKLQLTQTLEALSAFKDSADVFGNKIKSTFEDAFSGAFTDFIMGTKTAAEAFKSFALTVINELIKMQAQALAKSISNAVGGSSSGGGLFGGIGSFITGLFKAEGGPVAGGQSYIVGERGPEVFTPGVSGNIIPNGGNGAGGITIINNIDSRSDQATIQAAMQRAVQNTLLILQGDIQRGGTFARLIGKA